MASIELHFDGRIAQNHQVSLRTLSKSLTHLQNAIDRAYLEHRNGGLWKYARLSPEHSSEADFIVGTPRDGGYILDFLRANAVGRILVNRLNQAIAPAAEVAQNQGLEELANLKAQAAQKKALMEAEQVAPITFTQLQANEGEGVVRLYADRSINREIDQLLGLIRNEDNDSSLAITLNGDSPVTYDFDGVKSSRFHKVVAQRTLGSPTIYSCKVVELDVPNLKGQIENLETRRKATLVFRNRTELIEARALLGETEMFDFIGCPIVEYGAYDPTAGDVMFLQAFDRNG